MTNRRSIYEIKKYILHDQNSTDRDDVWPPMTRIPGDDPGDTTEKQQMGIRRKSNWAAGRKTILEADDESDLKQMLESFIGLR